MRTHLIRNSLVHWKKVAEALFSDSGFVAAGKRRDFRRRPRARLYCKCQQTLVAIIVAATLSACGGDGYSQTNRTPQIQGLTDQSVAQDTTIGPLPFSVVDADSDAGSVVVTAMSSDTSLIPGDNIILAGSGASRSLQLTPAADVIGTASITLRAVDPAGNTSTATIRVQVNGVFVSFLDTALTTFATDENGDQSKVSGLTFTPDADDNETAFDALLQ